MFAFLWRWLGWDSSVLITVAVPGPGWVATDNGLTLASAGPRVLLPGEVRRYYVEFAPLAEVQAGDPLAGPPAAVVVPAGGPFPSGLAVAGTRALVTLSYPPGPGDFALTVTQATAGGTVLVRSGWVHVPDLGVVTTPAPGVSAVPAYPGPGWVVSDDGLVYALGGPHRHAPGESRRYWMEFAPLAEIQAGDTIEDGTVLGDVVPTVGSSPAGLAFANIAVVKANASERVYVDITSGVAPTDYLVVFTVTLRGGAVVSRAGVLRCVNL